MSADIEIAGVVPAANVQARDVLAGSKRRVGGRSLRVAVKVGVVHRRLSGIVKMRRTMPDAVSLADFDVVHLLWQVGVERRTPDSFIDVCRNSEWLVDVTCIFNRVKAGLAHRREVEVGVLITQPLAPRRDLSAKDFLVLSVGRYAEYARSLGRVIERIEFQNCNLCSLGRIADLVVGDHRRTRPFRHHVRMNVPDHNVLSPVRRNKLRTTNHPF